jgi:hypothetical protein
MLRTILRDVASWCQIYLAAKPSLVVVNVDVLAYPMHHPTACNYQTKGQSFLSGDALSHHVAVGGGNRLSGGYEALELRY